MAKQDFKSSDPKVERNRIVSTLHCSITAAARGVGPALAVRYRGAGRLRAAQEGAGGEPRGGERHGGAAQREAAHAQERTRRAGRLKCGSFVAGGAGVVSFLYLCYGNKW